MNGMIVNLKKLGMVLSCFFIVLIAKSQTTPINRSSIIADGGELKLISNQFKFTEGPAVDKKGNIFFTDQPNNKIWKYDTKGNLSLFMENTGRSNGLFFGKKGELISAADENNQLWSIGKNGKAKVLVSGFNGKLFNGPNDLWIHPNGNIYFTDPFYKRDYWTRTTSSELDGQMVYLLAKGNTIPQMVASNLVKPNGIIGTPDGKYLYVADIGGNKTYRYDILENGLLENPILFVPQGSDGMTIDNEGNIYLTGKGVTVYNSAGQLIEQIKVPVNWTANVTFGGKNRNQLFITASESVFVLPMKVRGVK